MSKSLKKIETMKAPKAIGPYSQAIATDKLLFVSGQLPLDPVSGQLVESDIRLQTRQVLKNLEAILNAAGCDFTHVVRCDVFLMNMNDFKSFNEEYAKSFSSPTPPARQTIQVARLPLDALVEISCVALI